MPVMSAVWSPSFLTVTDCGALVVLTGTSPKSTGVGDCTTSTGPVGAVLRSSVPVLSAGETLAVAGATMKSWEHNNSRTRARYMDFLITASFSGQFIPLTWQAINVAVFVICRDTLFFITSILGSVSRKSVRTEK